MEVDFKDLELYKTYLVHVNFDENGTPLRKTKFFIGVFIGQETINGKRVATFRDIFEYDENESGFKTPNTFPTEGIKKVIFTTSKIAEDNFDSVLNKDSDIQNRFYKREYTPEQLIALAKLGGNKSKKNRKSKKKKSKKRKTLRKKDSV